MKVEGYRVIKGNDTHHHTFGGNTWKTPICPNCGTNLHLIFNFDLNDNRLGKLSMWEERIIGFESGKKRYKL